MSKQYIISTTAFKTKQEMEQQIQKWIDLGTYDDNSIVYEVNDDTPIYMPVTKLKKIV